MLFHDPAGPAAQAALALPDSADELAVAMADAVWAMGATGKFVWPIPDKGLARRLHRVTAPALVVWGEHDRLVSPVYAEEFAARLADARVEIVPTPGTCRRSSGWTSSRRSCSTSWPTVRSRGS